MVSQHSQIGIRYSLICKTVCHLQYCNSVAAEADQFDPCCRGSWNG